MDNTTRAIEHIDSRIEWLNGEHETLMVDFNNWAYTWCQFERLSEQTTNKVVDLLLQKKELKLKQVVDNINEEWIPDDLDEGMDLDINME